MLMMYPCERYRCSFSRRPQLERLRKVARLEDRPMSEIIRRATEEYLAKLPFAPRLAGRNCHSCVPRREDADQRRAFQGHRPRVTGLARGREQPGYEHSLLRNQHGMP